MRINKRFYKILGLVLIISSIILSAVSILTAFSLKTRRIDYLNYENIHLEYFSVQISDGANINGIMYVDKTYTLFTNKSVPTVLMLNGINSRKEDNIRKAFQLVKRGYAVFSVEQRGHGESSGPSAFLSKEPYDMVEVLDYIESNYNFVNATHFALYAFSYGGGIGAILQAIDDRIHASVLYHPLSSIQSFLTNIPIQNLIGSTPTIIDIESVQDAQELAHPNNTHNFLLIHGLSDILIYPQDSIDLYNLLNGTERTDIDIILRPGLGHGDVEYDKISLKYSLVWFEHYYNNNSIDLSDLKAEIDSLELYIFAYPNDNTSEDLTILSAFLLFVGFSMLLILYRIIPSWKKIPFSRPIVEDQITKGKYKKMIYYRTIAYLFFAMTTGILCAVFNTSWLYGYFILYPILTILILSFIPSELHSGWKEEWKTWLKRDLQLFLYNLAIIFIPLIYFLVFYNLNAKIMFKSIIPIINNSLFIYLLIGLSSGLMDYYFLREFKSRQMLILLALRPLSLLIFVLFVPLLPFPLLGGLFSHIMFFILFGVITYYIRQLVMILSKIFKNSIALYFLVMCPLIIFFIEIFFRII